MLNLRHRLNKRRLPEIEADSFEYIFDAFCIHILSLTNLGEFLTTITAIKRHHPLTKLIVGRDPTRQLNSIGPERHMKDVIEKESEMNSFRDTQVREERLGKTVARHCACEGHVDSLATSPKGQVMVPSFESLPHDDALMATDLNKSTWFERNHLNMYEHEVKRNKILPHEKPCVLLSNKRSRRCGRVGKATEAEGGCPR